MIAPYRRQRNRAGERDPPQPVVLGQAEIGDEGNADAGRHVVRDHAPPVDLHRDVGGDSVQPQDHLRDLPDILARRVSHEGIGGGFLDGDDFAPGQRMVERGDEHRAGVVHRMEFHVGRCDVHGGDDEVKLVVAKPLEPLLAGAGPYVDDDVGVVLAKLLQVRGQQVASRKSPPAPMRMTSAPTPWWRSAKVSGRRSMPSTSGIASW